jgi:hypothetical protein
MATLGSTDCDDDDDDDDNDDDDDWSAGHGSSGTTAKAVSGLLRGSKFPKPHNDDVDDDDDVIELDHALLSTPNSFESNRNKEEGNCWQYSVFNLMSAED